MKDTVDLSGDLDDGDSGTTAFAVRFTLTVIAIALVCANAGARFMCHATTRNLTAAMANTSSTDTTTTTSTTTITNNTTLL